MAARGPEPRDAADPRGRIHFYRALLLSSLLLCLSVAGFIYLWMMGETFGGSRSLQLRLGAPPPVDPLARVAAARRGTSRSVRIVQPYENIACAERERFDLWAQVERWREIAQALGFRAQVVELRSLPRRAGGVDLVIAPWLECLDAPAYEKLDRFARSGGGLIISGSLGAHGLPGSDTNPGRLGALAGATSVADFKSRPERFVLAGARTAPGAALDPGRRLELPQSRRAVAARAPHPVLYWSSFDLRPATARDGGYWAAAAVAARGRGRVAWFGFPVTQRLDETGAALDALRARAVAWAAGDRVAALAPWPDARPAAALLALDVEGEDEDALATARLLAAYGVRPTFFFTSSWLRDAPSVAPIAARVGEVAAQADRRRDLAGQARSRQRRRLHSSRRDLQLLSAEAVRGVHPPGEQVDLATLHATASVGFDYLLGDPAPDRAFPRELQIAGRALTLLSRAGADDDYALLVSESDLTGPEIVARLRADVRRLHALGGLYVLGLRSNLLGRAALRGALVAVVDELRERGAWTTTAAELVDWHRARGGLRLGFEPNGSGLVIANEGAATARGVVVEIYAGGAEPRRLPLAELAPGARVTLELDGPPELAIAARH